MLHLELVLFDSCKNVVFGKMLVFGNIFSFPGVNLAQNGPKPSFWDMSGFCFTLNFERLFRGCLFLMKAFETL